MGFGTATIHIFSIRDEKEFQEKTGFLVLKYREDMKAGFDEKRWICKRHLKPLCWPLVMLSDRFHNLDISLMLIFYETLCIYASENVVYILKIKR